MGHEGKMEIKCDPPGSRILKPELAIRASVRKRGFEVQGKEDDSISLRLQRDAGGAKRW